MSGQHLMLAKKAPKIASTAPVIPGDAILLTAQNPMGNAGNQWHVGYIPLAQGTLSPANALTRRVVINGAEASVFVGLIDKANWPDGSASGIRVCWFGTTTSVTQAYLQTATVATVGRASWTPSLRVPAAYLWPDATTLCHNQWPGQQLKTYAEVLGLASTPTKNLLAAFIARLPTDQSLYPYLQDGRTAYYHRASHQIEYGFMTGNATNPDFVLRAYTTGAFQGYPTCLDYMIGLAGPEWLPGPRDLALAYDITGHPDWKAALTNVMLWYGVKVSYNGQPAFGGGGYLGDGTPTAFGDYFTGYGDHRTTGRWMEAMTLGTQQYGISVTGGATPGWYANNAQFLLDIPLLLQMIPSTGKAGGFNYAPFANILPTGGAGALTGRVATAYNSLDAQRAIGVGDLPAIPSGASMTDDGTRRGVCVVFSTNGTTTQAAAGTSKNNYTDTLRFGSNLIEPSLSPGYRKYAKLVIIAEAGKPYVANVTPLTDANLTVGSYGALDAQGLKSYMTWMLADSLVLAHQQLDPSQTTLRANILTKLGQIVNYMFTTPWVGASNGFKYVSVDTIGLSGGGAEIQFNDHGGDGNSGVEPSLSNFGLEATAYWIAKSGDTTHAAKLQAMITGVYGTIADWVTQVKEYDEAMEGFFRAIALYPAGF